MTDEDPVPSGRMTAAAAKKLRAPFPPEQIGKLPKPTKADNPKGRCDECGGYHGLPAMHLDYVGHAGITDRLLEVDPAYSWEPMATDEYGLPRLDKANNLWIRLTVLGVTRIGVGDGKNAKEIIGDALRNAAMRFGVALDLWSKQDLHPPEEPAAVPASAARPRAQAAPSPGEQHSVKVPTWEELVAALAAADPTINWSGLVAAIVNAHYTLPMTADNKADLRQRMIVLVEQVTALMSAGDFPPPEFAEIQVCIALAFDGLAMDVNLYTIDPEEGIA